MAQHLTRNALCKTFVTTRRISTPINSATFTAGPPVPCPEIEELADGWSVVADHEDDSQELDDGWSVVADHVDNSHGPPDVLDEDPVGDLNLQDVTSFPVAFTNSAFHEVKLLKLLHDIGAPNYAFQSFMEWGRNGAVDDYHFQPCPQRYESQIRNLTELVGMQDCRPSILPVTLEPDNLTLDVVVFPFATMLSSLLNCPILNKLDNLVVNPNDRFGRYQSPDGLLDEINSGKWYRDTYDQTIFDPDKEFLAPIIFTMDKTVISEASHLSVYVILFTTSIFNREVSFVARNSYRINLSNLVMLITPVDAKQGFGLASTCLYPRSGFVLLEGSKG